MEIELARCFVAKTLILFLVALLCFLNFRQGYTGLVRRPFFEANPADVRRESGIVSSTSSVQQQDQQQQQRRQPETYDAIYRNRQQRREQDQLKISCPGNLVRVDDKTVQPPPSSSATEESPTLKIPRVIYQKSNSRCVHPEYAKIMNQWRDIPGHSYRLYDDDAVEEFLLDNPSVEATFPLLRHVLPCLESQKTAIADLWRAVVLYELGGIYVDMDSVPNGFDDNTIKPEDDAFFLLTSQKKTTQSFMVAAPHHPLMFYTVQLILHNVMGVEEVSRFDAAYTTGPEAVQKAFRIFMESSEDEEKRPPVFTVGNLTAGVYHGKDGYNVRIAGRTDPGGIVAHPPNPPAFKESKKKELYVSMNMTHFLDDKKRSRTTGNVGASCIAVMHNCRKGADDSRAPVPHTGHPSFSQWIGGMVSTSQTSCPMGSVIVDEKETGHPRPSISNDEGTCKNPPNSSISGTDCSCPETCTDMILAEFNGQPFTCFMRRQFLNRKYKTGLVAGCKNDACKDECNPDKCHSFEARQQQQEEKQQRQRPKAFPSAALQIVGNNGCVSSDLANRMEAWKQLLLMRNQPYHVLTDSVLQELLFSSKEWLKFPLVCKVCMVESPGMMTVLGGLLTLWEHGGVYIDVSTGPTEETMCLLEVLSSTPDLATFFKDDNDRVIPHVLAVPPKHGVIEYAIQDMLLHVALMDPLPPSLVAQEEDMQRIELVNQPRYYDAWLNGRQDKLRSYDDDKNGLVWIRILSKYLNDAITKAPASSFQFYDQDQWKDWFQIFDHPTGVFNETRKASLSIPLSKRYKSISQARLDGFKGKSCLQAMYDQHNIMTRKPASHR